MCKCMDTQPGLLQKENNERKYHGRSYPFFLVKIFPINKLISLLNKHVFKLQIISKFVTLNWKAQENKISCND